MRIVRKKKQSIHFIGIGGIGMSGIAEVLLSLDFEVTGSDVSDGPRIERLRSLGAQIVIGHKKENIDKASLVVYSSAVTDSNIEFSESRKRNLPTMRRAEMLAEIMRLKKSIAVAGTHGKTTTTSMLATILQESNLDPTYIIGGIVSNLEGNAKVGLGDYLVAEADESDGSFLYLNPIMAIITNIDNDHLNHFKTEENLKDAFLKFANSVAFFGLCAINFSDPKARDLEKDVNRPYVSFGVHCDEANYNGIILEQSENGCKFELKVDGEKLGQVKINLPGEHNVQNCLGAIAIAHNLGLTFEQIKIGVEKFKGVGRRLETLFNNDSITIIDDYAHHPTEIFSTLKAIRESRSDSSIHVYFEPHRFTRTRDCWNQFLHCFNLADKLFLLPIYPASENKIRGIDSKILAKDINKLHPGFASFINNNNDILKSFNNSSSKKITAVFLGAGSIGKKVRELVENL